MLEALFIIPRGSAQGSSSIVGLLSRCLDIKYRVKPKGKGDINFPNT
jgi:hypothetical protein